MPVLLGTSGWQYPHWDGKFYPADLAKSAQLTWYSARDEALAPLGPEDKPDQEADGPTEKEDEKRDEATRLPSRLGVVEHPHQAPDQQHEKDEDAGDSCAVRIPGLKGQEGEVEHESSCPHERALVHTTPDDPLPGSISVWRLKPEPSCPNLAQWPA